MLKTVFAVLAMSIAATAVMAQSDPIAERKALMKKQGGATREASAIAKGEAPFDAAKIQGVYDTYLDTTTKFAGLFPATTKTGDTKAGSKIWDDKAGFKAAFAKFEADAKAAKASTKDADSFKVAFGQVTQNCQSCHETYRNK